MEKENEEILDSTDFQEFVLREFEDMTSYSTTEEMAEYVFGSIEEAIQIYENREIE